MAPKPHLPVVRSLAQAALLTACAALAVAPAASAEPTSTQTAGREALKARIDAMLGQPPLLGARVAVEVTSLDDGQVVYTRRADELLNPASNTKLVTAAAALLRLGPEFRFTTEFRTDERLSKGRIRNLYIKGGGDPTINTERLQGLAADLFHRGVRAVQGDLVLDDRYFDAQPWGPGWEQESSDKSYAAPVSALSLNHNSVGIYVFPGERRGRRARVEVEPESRYFAIENKVQTVRSGGRRRTKVNTYDGGDQTRVVVRGRLPAGNRGIVVYRRIYDPTRYFGETLRAVLEQRGIKVSGRVRLAPTPDEADSIATYESPGLAEIVRDMNKVSSNFIAEMLLKALGAEVRGTPGTWKKGAEVAEELLAELGLPRGSYVLKNGSGLNDTNRFTAHQLSMLLSAVWKRFPVMAEFVSSLGIAGRDGTLRLRMEGTEAAGRLRAKTGTLEHVTALSGYVASLGGERFAFSIMVNDWTGRASPVVHTVDKLGGLIAAAGGPTLGPREEALALLAAAHGDQARPAELRARLATYASLAKSPDKKNLAFLRSALRTERDPVLRLAAADALYQSDPEQGSGPLLESASPELFARLRDLGRELSLPLPVVSSLLDLASDGSAEAISRVLAISPMAQDGRGDGLRAMLSDGLVEVGHNAPDELAVALRGVPADQSTATLELLGFGLAMAAEDAASFELAEVLRNEKGPESPRALEWLALLQRRVLPGASPATAPAGSAVPTPTAVATAATVEPAAAKGDQAALDPDEDDDVQVPKTGATAAQPTRATSAASAAIRPSTAPAGATVFDATTAPAAIVVARPKQDATLSAGAATEREPAAHAAIPALAPLVAPSAAKPEAAPAASATAVPAIGGAAVSGAPTSSTVAAASAPAGGQAAAVLSTPDPRGAVPASTTAVVTSGLLPTETAAGEKKAAPQGPSGSAGQPGPSAPAKAR